MQWTVKWMSGLPGALAPKHVSTVNIQQHTAISSKANNIQQHPTASNNIQQRPTASNNVQQHPTMLQASNPIQWGSNQILRLNQLRDVWRVGGKLSAPPLPLPLHWQWLTTPLHCTALDVVLIGRSFPLLWVCGVCGCAWLRCWMLLGVVGCCWVLLDVVGCCWMLLDVVGRCWMLLDVVG